MRNLYLLLGTAPMGIMSHYFVIITRLGAVAVSALVLATQPVTAQAPPRDASVQNRPVETSPSATEPSKTSASRHPLDPLQPAEIQRAVDAVRKALSIATASAS